jgi:predicted CXXCH cytochrome family protein
MERRKRFIGCLILLMVSVTILSGHVFAREMVLLDETKGCLSCHGKKGIVKEFENGESVAAHVDVTSYKTSVHNFLSCHTCHSDFSGDKHPKRRFRSKKQYKIRASMICRGCHKSENIKVKSIHTSLLSREKDGKSPVCTDCHSPHSTKATAGGKIFANERQYCLSCHGYDLEMTCKNGESIPLKVDISLLDETAHNKLRCSDCHYGFSSEEHPQRDFETRRDYKIASSESCRRCHFDKYTRTLDSVHFDMLSLGNLKAPVCTDCHGSHSISHISHGIQGRTFTTKRCQQCHGKIYEIYAQSVHGDALFNEHNQDVPICIDCHTAHDMKNPLTLEYHETIPEMCSNCHANAAIMGKYGLSTDVVKTYLSDFHGVTLGLYKQQREELYKPARPIAVCTDCHGTHNIKSVINADPALVKANLEKRCQKCHAGVTENFSNAWLFHYKPSLARFPLIFIVNLAYKFLVPIMLAGLILQILLHIWRYAVNR